MSAGPTFYGDVRTSDRDVSSSFPIVNILVQGKWLKEDTTTVEKFISNLQLVHDAGAFALYSKPDYATYLDKIVRQYMSQGKRFTFHLWTYFDGQDAHGNSVGTVHTASLYCHRCQLIYASGFPQSLGIKFEESQLTHRPRSRSGGYGDHRRHGRHGSRGYDYGYRR